MLEYTDFDLRLTAEEFSECFDALKNRLILLQQQARKMKIPVILLFEGWGASGKGRVISDLMQSLDARGFSVHGENPGAEGEDRYPFLHQYWARLPRAGDMAIFDRSWYGAVSVLAVEDGCGEEEYERRFREIINFERLLRNEGTVILRFFLHISEKEQKKRFERLEEDKATRWRVTKRDWKRHKQYAEYYRAFDRMLEKSVEAGLPWTIVEAHDRRFAAAKVYRTVVDALERALREREEGAGRKLLPYEYGHIHLLPVPRLEEVDLGASIEKEEYREELDALQHRLFDLQNRLYRKKIPLVLAYEGWDAAGKGGNIRRITKALDPRGYEVVPISAPTETERAYPYLWRFWTRLPKTGHTAVFDRTWYGRVLVERIEGFCGEEEWKRAYREINLFEESLTDFGTILLKFWLHIDREEQLRRFEERQNTPEKQWKITEEDWRNREKWECYEQAVNEMLERTSTEHAPWIVVESNDKKYARIKTLRMLVTAIEKRLS